MTAPHIKTDHVKPKTCVTEDPKWLRCLLLGLAFLFVFVFLLLPMLNVFYQALSRGVRFFIEAICDPNSRSAIKLTVLVAAVVVPVNTIFGIAAAWLISKFYFKGKTFLVTLIDLPFSVSPVVAGLMYLSLFGLRSPLGQWLDEHGIQIVFAVPGLILVTIFVTFPFIARELIPAMQQEGLEQEQAALTLGAGGWRTFWSVTLPSVRWALLYGIILCNARAIGEFGAVSVISGHITGKTDTMPLRVEKLYNEYNATAAFAIASLLALMALATLLIKTWLEWKQDQELLASEGMISDNNQQLTVR